MSLSINVHVRNDVPIVPNPLPSHREPLVSIEVGDYPGTVSIMFTDPADVDRLIRAAVNAKRYLVEAATEAEALRAPRRPERLTYTRV